MGRKIMEFSYDGIIDAYCRDFEPMPAIAKRFNVSRQSIWKVLKANGVDTSKGKRIERGCAWCEGPVLRVKSQIRGRNRVFCNRTCYDAWLSEIGAGYNGNRNGQRVARSVVGQYFTLEDGMVVHHEDKNTLNNMVRNLKVFACNGDHVRYHRGCGGEPIWDGSNC